MCGLVEGAAQGLEDRFDDVVQVLAVEEIDVQIRPGVIAEGDTELLDELDIEGADLGLGESAVEDRNGRPEKSTAAEASASCIGMVPCP